MRETFWNLVGGRPERTPLNARTVGSFERPRYRVEKVVYESQPNFHISGTLYIPTVGQPPFPGVLYQMGHTTNGKGDATYQLCCQTLAGLGYLVLGFDPMGQGERTYYPGRTPSRSRLGADEEHTFPARQMLFKGISSTWLQTWDAVRSLDYLASHPLVDPKRLASTGQSGGGTNTMLLAAVDDRLAAAVVSSGNTENVACANFNPPGSTDDGEQNLVASAPVDFDRWDLLYPIAPKPLLVMVSQRDFFGTYSPNYLTSGIEEFQKLQRVYRTLGHPERIAWFDTPLPHGFSFDLRMQMYNWFERWIKGESQPVPEEPVIQAETEEALFRFGQWEHGAVLSRGDAVHAQPQAIPVEDAGGSERVAAYRSSRRYTGRHHGSPRNVSQEPGGSGRVPRRAEGVGTGLAVSAQGQRPFEATGDRAGTRRQECLARG